MKDVEVDLIVGDEGRRTMEGPRIESMAIISLLAGQEALRQDPFKDVGASEVMV